MDLKIIPDVLLIAFRLRCITVPRGSSEHWRRCRLNCPDLSLRPRCCVRFTFFTCDGEVNARFIFRLGLGCGRRHPVNFLSFCSIIAYFIVNPAAANLGCSWHIACFKDYLGGRTQSNLDQLRLSEVSFEVKLSDKTKQKTQCPHHFAFLVTFKFK